VNIVNYQPRLRPGAGAPESTLSIRGETAATRDLPDTAPKLLERNARDYGTRPAVREKSNGIWQTWTWAEVRLQVRGIAAGLAAIGVKRGDRVALIGDNRPQLYWSMCACQMLGAVPVPAFQDWGEEEMGTALGGAGAKVGIVEDQEQVDKLLAIRARNALPAHIIYKDPRGLRDYAQPGLMSLEDLMARGAEFLGGAPGFLDPEITKGKGSDVSVILHSSGTAGQPKGVMLTHDNVIISAHNAVRSDGLTVQEEVLAYLPMAWIFDHILSYGASYVAGFCISCPESGATLFADLREIGPTFFLAPPRIFETVLTTMSTRMAKASRLKRAMYEYFMAVARRADRARLDGKPVAAGDRLLYWLGGFLVYGPIKDIIGLSRMRLGYAAGDAIGPDVFAFYRCLGLHLKQLYGATETGGMTCMQQDGQIKADAVGVPAPEVEIKIANNGEVLVKGPGVFAGYDKDDRLTAEIKIADGWVRTGDSGFFDADGQLRIVDRIQDVGRLNDGTVFSPKYLENKLKFFPYIKEAVAFGLGRDYVATFISINLEAVAVWIERQGSPFVSYQELAAKPEVYDLIQGCVEQVNRDLAADKTRSGAQIRRFLLLHKELDADDGELTRTGKLRRHFIAERYAPLVDGLYGISDRAQIRTIVTFKDGRQGAMEAALSIREATRPTAAPRFAEGELGAT
jgi:long-chain acyl-CoA synthetase